jgi:hypothetical protein
MQMRDDAKQRLVPILLAHDRAPLIRPHPEEGH